jgi:hypothetical protein
MSASRIMRPLLVVNSEREISRLEFALGDQNPTNAVRLRCPRSPLAACSANCAACALVALGNDDYAFECLAFARVVVLGILDGDRVNHELIDNMKAGTAFRESLRARSHR